MHYYFDFSDILNHVFILNDMFIKKNIEDFSQFKFLIDAKKIFT